MAFPATYNLYYYRGDTMEFVIQPKNADGTAFDLTGYDTNLFTIISSVNNVETLMFTGSLAVNTTDNYITCSWSTANGETLEQGTQYLYDIQIFNGVKRLTLIAGSITVTNDISGRIV